MPSTISDRLSVKKHIKNRTEGSNPSQYNIMLLILILSALVLVGRLSYLYTSDSERFPITTIKVAASYQHVTHQELETILAKYVHASFFRLPVTQLQNELNSLDWMDTAYVERVWPDTLKIKLVEKEAVAFWNRVLMTDDGRLFKLETIPADLKVPKLKGPETQQLEVLQVYKKLSKILSGYGLQSTGLYLRDNSTWILVLDNNIKIYLGKKELDERLERFCKAYPAVFAEKIEQLASVDLRYPRGMAVQWKQQVGR